MKSKIEIKTLTPIHIGSGINYPNHIEFITQKDSDGDLWGGIVDVNKIFDLIGFDNLQKWTATIEHKQDIFKFLRPYNNGKNIQIENITKRTFPVYGQDIRNKKDLKEQLHSINKPMIPGSSLKGAFRTAILSHLILKFPDYAKRIINTYKKDFSNWSLRDFQNISKEIENKYLTGVNKNNANNDIFRFLAISDALFEEGSTIATVVKVLSLHRNGWEFKEGSQLTECIGVDGKTTIQIKINDLSIKRNIENKNLKIPLNIQKELLQIFNSTENLFEIVNNHTKKLLNREIELWEEQIKNPNPVNEILDTYLDGLKSVREEFSENHKQCIVRVGGNEGWDFITGAWANSEFNILSKKQWDKLFHMLNKGRRVDIFPKSRKIDEDGDLMGFVKITKSN